MIGTGPFMLKEFRPTEKLVLERYDNYHGGVKKLQRMEFVHMDENTALMEFEAGNIDITDISDARLIAWYLGSPEYRDMVHRVEQSGVILLSFNMQMEPFTDREVRRAISMAINREEIANQLLQGCTHRPRASCPTAYSATTQIWSPLSTTRPKPRRSWPAPAIPMACTSKPSPPIPPPQR